MPAARPMELDHVFVFVDDLARAERSAVEAGLVPTHRRRHPGQGTENVCFGFGSAFLELLRVCDPSEITSERVLPTGLWARSRWRTTGACPFGVCLRGAPTFPTWTYDVPFPPGISVEMSSDSAVASVPLLFAFAGAATGRTAVQPLGRSITAVALDHPGAIPDRVPALTTAGVVERPGVPRLGLTIDGGRRGVAIDIPHTPVRLHL